MKTDRLTNTHILSFTTVLSKVSNVLTSQTLWNLGSHRAICVIRGSFRVNVQLSSSVSSTTSATHTDTRLTYWLHCHSGSLWLAVGLAVGFPFRHSTLVDTRIWRRDLIELQGEGVSRRARRLHSASGQLPPGFHNTLLTKADDICKNGCGSCFVLPGDGELTFDPKHLTCEHQLVPFIDFHNVLHFKWEPTFCDETRDMLGRIKLDITTTVFKKILWTVSSEGLCVTICSTLQILVTFLLDIPVLIVTELSQLPIQASSQFPTLLSANRDQQ